LKCIPFFFSRHRVFEVFFDHLKKKNVFFFQDYTLIDISEDGFISLMDDSGNTKDDLALPKGTDDSEKLAVQIQKDFDEGKELVVSVLKSMGEEMVCAVKTVGGGGN
jgi:hypothetical protein